MKWLPWLPPVIALVVVGFWILPQRDAWHENQGKGGDRSDARGREIRRGQPATSAAERLAVDLMTADWKVLAEEYKRAAGAPDMSGSKARKAYLARIEPMSVDELAEVFRGIPDDGWDREVKEYFQRSLVLEMANKDAGRCLDFQGERMRSGGDLDAGMITPVLTEVAGSQPERAIAWLDQMIDGGALDSIGQGVRNEKWLGYEAALVAGLLKGNPVLAEQRVAGFSEEVRERMLVWEMMKTAPVMSDTAVSDGWLGMCRRYLDDEEFLSQMRPVASRAMQIGGIQAVAEFLDRVKAPPSERAAMASASALEYLDHVAASREPVLSDIETVRGWALEQGAKDADRITGEALGKLAGRTNFGPERAFEALQTYQDRGAGDALVAGFLSRPAVWNDPDRCRELAGRIQNAKLRASCMKSPQ